MKSLFLMASFFMVLLGGEAQAQVSSYVLGVGDSIAIQVFDEKELSGTFTVGEGGVIDYPLVGRVDVAGQTIAAFDESLTAELGEKFLRDPQVQVEVLKFRSQPVQVLGAVKKPGLVHLSGRSSVLDVIAEAGGVSSGGVAEIRVQFADVSKESIAVSFEELMADSNKNIQLTSGDVLHVSEGMVVYVTGEVNKPGAVPFTEGLTVTQALSRSGGTKRTARTRDAYILRGEDRIPINLNKVMRGKSADVVLHPNDQIVLQESIF